MYLMKVLVADRRAGKTTRLLDWMQAAPEGEHRVMVCMSGQRAMNLLRQSREEERGLESWQFVGVDEVKPGSWPMVLRGRGGHIVLGIDDLDIILTDLMAGYRVGMVTMTGEAV